MIIDLSCDDDSNQDISFLVNNFEQQVYQEHGKHDGTILKISETCTVLCFYSETKMSVKLSKLLSFGGKRWKIKSLVTTKDCCFRTKGGYVNGWLFEFCRAKQKSWWFFIKIGFLPSMSKKFWLSGKGVPYPPY